MSEVGKKPTVEDEAEAIATEDNEDDWEDEDSEEEEVEDDEEGSKDEDEDAEIDHEDIHELAMKTNALLMLVVHLSILHLRFVSHEVLCHMIQIECLILS
jgi:hypothetical protein